MACQGVKPDSTMAIPVTQPQVAIASIPGARSMKARRALGCARKEAQLKGWRNGVFKVVFNL
jgi:hypothetical protein